MKGYSITRYIDVDLLHEHLTYKPCPYCFGTGRLKAMQSMVLYNGESARANDVLAKCKHCDGIGVKYERD